MTEIFLAGLTPFNCSLTVPRALLQPLCRVNKIFEEIRFSTFPMYFQTGKQDNELII